VTESIQKRVEAPEPVAEEQTAKRAWEAPRLMVLGDAQSLTAIDGSSTFDGETAGLS
jgi:hypothetical protein